MTGDDFCISNDFKLAHTCNVKSLTEHLWFEVPNRRRFVNNIRLTIIVIVHGAGKAPPGIGFRAD